MWNDPIVEEVREARDQLAGRFAYGLRALVEYLRKKEREGVTEVVGLEAGIRKRSARGSTTGLRQP